MNYICPIIWILGATFPIDEMIMGIKGKLIKRKEKHLQSGREWLSGECVASGCVELSSLYGI